MTDTQKSEPQSEKTPVKSVSVRDRYTSVVYVHGIGSQRRYEETSRLVDRLDRHQFNEHRRGKSKGMLSNIKARVEPLRASGKSGIVGYIRTFFNGKSTKSASTTVRFYEIYWAPTMADVASPLGVVRWLFRQPLRPWKTAFSPWRERQRLRRGTLTSLFKSGSRLPEGVEQRDWGQLLELYNDFEGLGAQRDYPKGRFKDFLSYVSKKESKKPDRLKRHLKLARHWRRAYVLEEIRNAFVLSTIALALVLLGLGTLLVAIALLASVVELEWIKPLIGGLEADWPTAGAGLVSLFGFLGLGKLLTNYLGDVEAWATYEETDSKNVARNKVLDQSMELLSHVLSDEGCERVVIVAHSLGTSIANDALLALARRNRAANIMDHMNSEVQLGKIDQFVTLGSPIDKIEYFFESYSSQSHRYKRVAESMRGDINSAPFSDAHVPYIHWTNFWDEGDPISGSLQSPSGSSRYLQQVDDVHVATYAFPAPGASHAGYFDNKKVISALFDIIFHREHSFWSLAKGRSRKTEDYTARAVGPGIKPGARRRHLTLALVVPWVILAGIIASQLDYSFAASCFWVVAASSVIVLFIAYVLSRLKGPLKPI